MSFICYDFQTNSVDLPRTLFLSMLRNDFGYYLPNIKFSDLHYEYEFLDNWICVTNLETGEFQKTYFTNEIALKNRRQIFWQFECSQCRKLLHKWFLHYTKILRMQLQKRLLVWFKGYTSYKLDFETIINDFDKKINNIKFR